MPTSGLRTHPEGIDALFAWMVENWEAIIKKLPPTLSMFGTMVSIFTSSYSTKEQLARVEKFFDGKNTNGYDQSLAQSLDAIRSKVSWVERDRAEVKEWLKKNGYGS